MRSQCRCEHFQKKRAATTRNRAALNDRNYRCRLLLSKIPHQYQLKRRAE